MSISKWESKWCKPFMENSEKTYEESVDYLRCMTLTQNVDPSIYHLIPKEVFQQITDYIKAPMTATTIRENARRRPPRKRIITSELIYYWMAIQNIPPEYQKWHINRLFTLLKVFEAESNPKKMTTQEILAQNRELNEARKKMYNTTG